MRQNNHCPCHLDGNNCDRREVGCHAVCEDYKKWKAELDAKNEHKRKEKAKTQTMSESAKRKMWRKQRYRNQQKPFRRDVET